MGRKRNKEYSDFRITNYGVKNEVTGTSVLVEVDGLKILLEMGGLQSQRHDLKSTYSINLRKLKIPLSEIDVLCLNHFHNDHIFLAPILAKEDVGFSGIVVTPEPNIQMMSLNFYDANFIMQQECKLYNKKYPNKPLYPLYNEDDIRNFMLMLRGYGYNQDIWLNDRVKLTLIPNGHTFGSSSTLITYIKDEYTTKTLLYTSDTYYGGEQKRPFTKSADMTKVLKPNVAIVESTYGGRYHEYTDIEKTIENYILEECVRKGNKLIIPAFALCRSSQILYYVKKAFDNNKEIAKNNPPILFCGKMLNSSHAIISNPSYKNEFIDEEWHDSYDLFKWGKVTKVDSFKELEGEINDNRNSIIISSGGMCHAGGMVYILQQLINKRNVSFMSCGFQAEGTTGYEILKCRNNDKKEVTIQGKKYFVNMNILDPISMSGHSDDKGLCDLVSKGCDNKKLQKIILIHGDEEAKRNLKSNMEIALGKNWCSTKGKEILIPKPNDVIKV